MGETAPVTTRKVIEVGPDRVTVSETELVIEAKNPMPDWQVLELNPIPVYFEDKKYFLVEIRKSAPPFATRYLLHPWPEENFSNSKLFHAYDAETVAERDAGKRSGQMDEVTRACLLPFYPFLGLLWSGVQQRLVRFGFVPHTITGVSVFTGFLLVFAQGVFATVMINASLRSGKMMLGGMVRAMAKNDTLLGIPIYILDSLLLVACLADVAVRYSHYLREDQWFGGFLEWLMPKRKPRLDP
jgi:hypothetical protein